MSARKDESQEWEIVFKYRGKKANHWRPICSFIGTEREAVRQAEALYAEFPEAIDFMTTPIEERP